MKRLSTALAGLAAICLLAVGLSGCNVRFTPYAAVVNGSEISQAQLRSALAAISANDSYKCAIQASGSTHIAGAGQGTYSSAFSAQVLSILIQDKVVRQAVARERLPEPAGLYAVAFAQLEAATAPPSTCPGSAASLMAAFAPSYRTLIVKFQEDEDALAASLSGVSLDRAPLASYAVAHAGLMSLACVSVIEVAAKSTASSLRGQLLRGASFAALAKAHSADSTSAPQGGALGCIPDSEFTSPLDTDLAALKVGQVSSPISFSSELAAPPRDQEAARVVPAAGHEPGRERAAGLEQGVPAPHQVGQGPGRPAVRHLGHHLGPVQGATPTPLRLPPSCPTRAPTASGPSCTGSTPTRPLL